MTENGILPRFSWLSHLFLKVNSSHSTQEPAPIIGLSNLQPYFRALITMWAVAIGVFIGELIHYYIKSN